MSSPHEVVCAECDCIVVFTNIAGRRCSEAKPQAGDDGVAVSGAGGRLPRLLWADGIALTPPRVDQHPDLGDAVEDLAVEQLVLPQAGAP